MAERRMFSKQIIDSDIFLDMPQTTQNLYFHLNIRADDEGFVNSPKKIMRMVGSNQNDLEILLSKRYVIGFESGVIVIKHFKLHNTIRKDRMKETLYTDEKAQIVEKENGSYTDLQPNVNQVPTRRTHSIVEYSEVENSIVKNKYNPSDDFVFFNDLEFQEVWKDFKAVRTKKKASNSDRAIKGIITKLVEYSKNDKLTAIEIIGKSADSGWSNIYELKAVEKKGGMTEQDYKDMEDIF